MKKKTPEEMRRAKITKAARTLIRLKHSLAADEEINSFLPDKLDEFDEALARGDVKKLTAGMGDVMGGTDASGD